MFKYALALDLQQDTININTQTNIKTKVSAQLSDTCSQEAFQARGKVKDRTGSASLHHHASHPPIVLSRSVKMENFSLWITLFCQ